MLIPAAREGAAHLAPPLHDRPRPRQRKPPARRGLGHPTRHSARSGLARTPCQAPAQGMLPAPGTPDTCAPPRVPACRQNAGRGRSCTESRPPPFKCQHVDAVPAQTPTTGLPRLPGATPLTRILLTRHIPSSADAGSTDRLHDTSSPKSRTPWLRRRAAVSNSPRSSPARRIAAIGSRRRWIRCSMRGR